MKEIVNTYINSIFRFTVLMLLAEQEEKDLKYSMEGLEELLGALEELKEIHCFHCRVFFHLHLSHLFKIEKKMIKDAPQSEVVIYHDFST